MIVRRPRTNEREVLAVGEIDLVEGLVGDKWREAYRLRLVHETLRPGCDEISQLARRAPTPTPRGGCKGHKAGHNSRRRCRTKAETHNGQFRQTEHAIPRFGDPLRMTGRFHRYKSAEAPFFTGGNRGNGEEQIG